jgi:thymidine phosphorylase
VLTAVDTRALGLAVVELGGGRRRAGQAVDPRVGLAGVCPLGSPVQAGQPLAWVHAADEAQAGRALQALGPAFTVSEEGRSAFAPEPAAEDIVLERLDGLG